MASKKIFYGWKIVFASMIVLAINGPATVAVANIFQIPITQEFGISASLFSLINVVTLGVGIFASPYVANKITTDKFKSFLIFSSILYAIFFGLLGLSPNIWISLILSLFVGFGYCATSVLPVATMINNWFISKRGIALSLALSGFGLGGVVFSYLLTFLINNFGWRYTYIIYALIMLLISLPLIAFIYKQKPEDINEKPLEIMDNKRQDNKKVSDNKINSKFDDTLKTTYFALLMVGAVLIGISNNSGLGQFPPFLNQLYDINPAVKAATVIAIYSAFGIVGKILLGIICDKFGTVKAVVFASSILAISYILIIFAKQPFYAISAAVLFGLGNGIGTVVPPLFTSSIYSNVGYPKAYGYVQSSIQLGMTLGSFIAASIAGIYSYNMSWIVSSIICVAMAICWVYSYKLSKKTIGVK